MVMAGLVPAVHVFPRPSRQVVDGRTKRAKPGHDGIGVRYQHDFESIGHRMTNPAIRAAIVGLGWWGRNLVDAVRHSDAIRFTAAHTRTAATVADFCREHDLRWIDDLDTILRDPAIDAVVFATPHSLARGADHARRCRREGCVRGEAVHPFRRRCAGSDRRRRNSRRRAGGWFQPTVPPVDDDAATGGEGAASRHDRHDQRRADRAARACAHA